MLGYMFDTNIFNAILDGDVDIPATLSNLPIFLTHVQLDEIKATRNEVRRAQLARTVTEVPHQQIPTSSFVIGVSRLGQGRLSNGVLYQQLRVRLDELNRNKTNNPEDIAMAETALKENLTLVTHDRDLARVVVEFGGATCTLDKLLRSHAK